MGEIATALGLDTGSGGRLCATPPSAVARQIACGGRRPRRRRSARDRRIHEVPAAETAASDTSASAGDDALAGGEEIVLERGQRVAVRIRIELENLGLSAAALTQGAEDTRQVEPLESEGDSIRSDELQDPAHDSMSVREPDGAALESIASNELAGAAEGPIPGDELPGAVEDPIPSEEMQEPSEEMQEFSIYDTGEDSLRECVEAHVKLLSELAAPIVDAEGADHLRARLAEFTGFLAPQHPQLLRSLVFRRGGVLDPEDLIDRALRVPEEREREVQLALGELVAYLEFELLNHPGIEDGASILEGLQGLRSRL